MSNRYNFATEIKNHKIMEEKVEKKDQKQYIHEEMDVRLQTQQPPHMRVMRGKALYDAQEKDITFIENEPRGPRSVEVGRSAHGRLVRRPDGMYTYTLRIDPSLKYLRETMVAEVGNIIKMVDADRGKVAQEASKKKGAKDV